MRIDTVGVRTKSYVLPGGMQHEYTPDARAVAEREACDYLVRKWPHLVQHNETKKSLYPELRFKRCKMDVQELRSYQAAIDKETNAR